MLKPDTASICLFKNSLKAIILWQYPLTIIQNLNCIPVYIILQYSGSYFESPEYIFYISITVSHRNCIMENLVD